MDAVNVSVDKMAEDGQDGCKGPDSAYLKLIASDGHVFIVKRKLALMSKAIKFMLTGPGEFAEHETNEIHLKDFPSHILQQICVFLSYKACYENCLTGIPGFVVPPEMALELLEAAKYLEC